MPYDYEYNDTILSTNHTFFSKIYRTRLVLPGKVVVKKADGTLEGSATSADALVLPDGKIFGVDYRILNVASAEQSGLIATAMIQRAELDHERGSGLAPMNVGQECYDYVKITDSREGDNRVGNVGYLVRYYEPGKEKNFYFGFGNILLGANMGMGGIISEQPYVTYAEFTDQLKVIYENLNSLFDYVTGEMGWIQELAIPENVDDVADGTSYARLLTTQISAGKLYLSDTAVYLAGYNPSTKRRVFINEPTTPYDLGDLWADGSVLKRCTTARATGAYTATDWTQLSLDELKDGSTYKRVLATDITAGHILLSEVTGDLDDLDDGTSYGKILLTQIDAGHLKLTSDTVASGVWYNETYVEIDATAGITLKRSAAGNPFNLIVKYGANIVGYLYPVSDALALLGNPNVYVGTTVDGGITIYAGTIAVSPSANELKLGAVGGASLASGAIDSSPVGNDIWIDSDDDVWIFADTDILLQPTNKTYINNLGVIASSVTASRAIDTIYRNTSGYPLLVQVQVLLTASTTMGVAVNIGSGTPPDVLTATLHHTSATASSGKQHTVFIVPVSWYYSLTTLTATPTLSYWTEYKIGASA